MTYTDETGAMIIDSDDAYVKAMPARNEPDRLKLMAGGPAYLTEDDARDLGKYLTDWANGHA